MGFLFKSKPKQQHSNRPPSQHIQLGRVNVGVWKSKSRLNNLRMSFSISHKRKVKNRDVFHKTLPMKEFPQVVEALGHLAEMMSEQKAFSHHTREHLKVYSRRLLELRSLVFAEVKYSLPPEVLGSRKKASKVS